MDCHSLGLFYKISYYSFFLRPLKIEKIQNHLIFKMLVRAANAFVGLPQYDKNEYPKVHSSNSNTSNNCEEPILLYNSDSSIDS